MSEDIICVNEGMWVDVGGVLGGIYHYCVIRNWIVLVKIYVLMR